METAWKAGLEDVIAARSAICRVDGEAGRLYYRGYEIGDLARAVSFEDVPALLWFGELPSTAEAGTVAAWQRIRTGQAPVEAPGMDSHATYFLELLSGRAPAPEVARVLDVVLTLHADHEFNASTFAGRVAIATLADLHAAVVAAIAT